MKPKFFQRLNQTILPFLLSGVIIGLISGIFIYAYNHLAEFLLNKSMEIYSFTRDNLAFLPLIVVGIVALALISGQIIKHIPNVRGGGVPFTEGLVRGKFTVKWFITLPAMFVSSLISIFMGLSLGSEGPSIYMGGNLGYGMADILKKRGMEKRVYASAGACAGLAVAFNTPLAGIMFALEEAHRKFNAQIIAPALAAVITGVITQKLLFGDHVFLGIYSNINVEVGLSHIVGAIIIGILCGFLGCFFSYAATRKIAPLDKVKNDFKVLVPAALAVILGLFLPDALGAGKFILVKISSVTLTMLGILLVVKFIFIVMCSRSTASGGIFVPMLTLGALTGAIIANILNLIGFNCDIVFLSLIGASSFFAAAVRAPITSIIIAFEITRFSLEGILCASIGVLFAYGVAEFLHKEPLYEIFLSRILDRMKKYEKEEVKFLEFKVEENCFACDRQLRDIILPDNTLITKITRNGYLFIPEGDAVILAGDLLEINCQDNTAADDETELKRIFICDKLTAEKIH